MTEKIFARGLYFNPPHNNAPGFVLGSMGIHRERFIEWLQQQPVNDGGYLKLDVLRGRTPDEHGRERFNVTLNDWQPQGPRQQGGPTSNQPSGLQPAYAQSSAQQYRDADSDFDEDIPF